METKLKKRDRWDKVEILGKVFLIPLTIAIFGFFGNYQISQINSNLSAKLRDVEVMDRFSNLYYQENEKSRRLSIHFIKLTENEDTRFVLRQFVIWDALERNITEDFIFDSELDDWHMVGDTLYDMASDDRERFEVFFCNIVETTKKRWPKQETELSKLYSWIRYNYQDKDVYWSDCLQIDDLSQ